jgi:hypothetical protein
LRLHLFGGEQKQIWGRLAAADLRSGENMRRELVVKTGAGEAVANLFRCSAGSYAFGQLNRVNRLADIGDGAEFAGVALQRGLLHLGFEIVRQFAAHFAFDGLARFTIRHAEKPFEDLFCRDRIAMTRQRLGMRTA